MTRIPGAALLCALAAGFGTSARGDEAEARAVVDKAIKAVGGEEALGKIQAMEWKSEVEVTFGGSTNAFTGRSVVRGLDRLRSEFEGEFNGNEFKGVTVLAGDKGWRKFGDQTMDMDADAVANEQRQVYLQVVPVLLVPLKGPGFKLDSAPEEKVGGKAADVVKVTPPDGKSFRISFDRESGLPVKLVAEVVGFGGEAFEQETTFAGYKEMGGIKKATKIESKRDGEPFVEVEILEFKPLERVDDATFAEPD